MKKTKIYLIVSLVLFSILSVLTSCKKEYVKTPYSQIEGFSITDSLGKELKASIVGDSIIVYWPPFQLAPVHITPQITISSGAQISPASGTKVAFALTTIYTVTAQDGSTKTYKLFPLKNEPAPVFDITNIASLQLGGQLFLQGQYIIPDTTQTKLFILDTSNKEISLSLKGALQFNTFGIKVNLPQDNSIDTGYHKIKMVSGKNTTISGPYHFAIPNCPAFTTSQTGQSLQKGQTLTFSLSGPFAKYYYNSFVGGQVTMYIGDNFDTVNTVVNSQNNGTITVVIPQNTPLGLVEGLDFGDKNGNILQSWFPASPDIKIVQ